MKICIIRNAEARTNAAIARITDGLYEQYEEICILSRSRLARKEKGIIKLSYRIGNGKVIDNYEIVIKSKTGRGLKNIFQLVVYLCNVMSWLLKNQKKYDVIHAFDLDSGLPAYIMSKLSNKNIYVYHIADFYADSRPGFPQFLAKWIRKLEYLVINNAKSTIICTEDRIKQIEGSKPKKLTVIHNTPMIKKELLTNLSDDRKSKNMDNYIFTYIGVLSERRFIVSATNVIKDYPQIELHLAGMGDSDEYVSQMADIHDNIFYYGMVDYTEALKMYSNTDFMFALYDPNVPNHKYSAPNKVYESMILGKPIIVAKGTGIDRIVEDNDTGYCINYSEDDFRSLLNEIVSGTTNWEEKGWNALKSSENYTWDIMKQRLKDLYKSIEEDL